MVTYGVETEIRSRRKDDELAETLQAMGYVHYVRATCIMEKPPALYSAPSSLPSLAPSLAPSRTHHSLLPLHLLPPRLSILSLLP